MSRGLRLTLVLLATSVAMVPAAQAQQTTDTDSSRAVTAARSWLMLVDSGRWQASVDSASDLFRQIVGSPANWQQFATNARSLYPISSDRELVSWEANYAPEGAPAGRYARATFETKGTRVTRESIVLTLTPSGWRVAMYGITGG